MNKYLNLILLLSPGLVDSFKDYFIDHQIRGSDFGFLCTNFSSSFWNFAWGYFEVPCCCPLCIYFNHLNIDPRTGQKQQYML